MKKLALALIAAVAVSGLSACGASYGEHNGYYFADNDWSDAYYDNGYGPYYDGYWGADGVFFFRDADGHPFRRDDAHHFRHDSSTGFHSVRAHAHEPRDHR